MDARDKHLRALELARNGRTEEGLAILKEEIAKAENAGQASAIVPILRSAGILSRQLGDLADAIRLYEQARAVNPKDPYVYLALSELYEMVGSSTSAQRCNDLFEQYADPVADADLLQKIRTKKT